MENYLKEFIRNFSSSIEIADKRKPQKISRTGTIYKHGIGPHTEDETVDLVLKEFPISMQAMIKRSIPYPNNKRNKCDLLINSPEGKLFVEIKMLRMFGDNGKPNDNMIMHILSPYPQQRSALTDIKKLNESRFDGYKAIMIYGYDYDNFPTLDMIECFENLAKDKLQYPRINFNFKGLIHSIHKNGNVYAWMLR